MIDTWPRRWSVPRSGAGANPCPTRSEKPDTRQHGGLCGRGAAKPGLCYFVKAGAAADSLTVTGNGELATGDSVTLDMPLPDNGVKYYKVVASPTSSL